MIGFVIAAIWIVGIVPFGALTYHFNSFDYGRTPEDAAVVGFLWPLVWLFVIPIAALCELVVNLVEKLGKRE